MSHVTITIEEHSDGQVGMVTEFDPPLGAEYDAEPLTHLVALKMLSTVASDADIVGTRYVGEDKLMSAGDRIEQELAEGKLEDWS